MRTIVPIFALFAVFFSGSIAVAVTPTERCQQIGSSCDVDAAKKIPAEADCGRAHENAVKARNVANNCASRVPDPEKPSSSGGSNVLDPGKPSNDAIMTPDPGKPSNDGGVSVLAETMGQRANLDASNCAELIGTFAGRAAACENACRGGINSSSLSGANGSANTANQYATECHGMTVSKAVDSKEALDKIGSGANDTKDASTASPSSGSSGSGSGSGGNPMAALGQLASALGQAMQPQSQTDPQTDMTQADCSTNPMLAGCTTDATSNGWNTASTTGTAGYQSDTDSNSQNFNTGDPGTNLQTASIGNPYNPQVNPSTVNPIPPGGGGFMAASGPGAQVGSQGRGGGYYGASNRADILHGEHGGGGGYTQTLAGMDTKSGGGGGFSGYGNGPNNAIDLKQFLPGGSKYAGARAPAGLAPASAQINSPQVNVWNRISERIRARCAEGRLRDCVP